MRVSINQPYAFPFRGWYRLLECDLHIVLDDAQMIRRGYVHRNQFHDRRGQLQWLTLPLAHAPQDTLIKDMVFAADAQDRWAEQVIRFPALFRLPYDVFYKLMQTWGNFTHYAVDMMVVIASHLGIQPAMQYASTLNLSPDLRGQDRIIAICKAVGANEYLNSPGGRSLYDPAAFEREGIKLEFLEPWKGEQCSVLETLAMPERKAA